jgi:hypothetical protein
MQHRIVDDHKRKIDELQKQHNRLATLFYALLVDYKLLKQQLLGVNSQSQLQTQSQTPNMLNNNPNMMNNNPNMMNNNPNMMNNNRNNLNQGVRAQGNQRNNQRVQQQMVLPPSQPIYPSLNNQMNNNQNFVQQSISNIQNTDFDSLQADEILKNLQISFNGQ